MKTVRISIGIPSKGGTGSMGFNDFFYGKDKGYNEIFTSNTRSIRVEYLPIGRYQVNVTCVDGWYENERTIEIDLPSFRLVIELCVLIDPIRDGMGDSVIVYDDRVAVSLDWYNENKNEYGNVNCPLYVFSPTMRQYCGTIRTIKRVDNFDKKYKMTENSCFFDWTDEMIEGLVEEVNTLKIQSNNMETETHRGYYTTEEETANKSKKVAWFTFGDNDFADKVELDLSNRELIHEDGKWFVVKKKKEYPKTYEECCQVLGISDGEFMFDGLSDDEYDLFDKFVILKRCRDAYWKIAGEEMGLGKPWEPDWKNYNDYKFVIGVFENEIIKCYNTLAQYVFAFPIEEMRDAFYDNFKEEIEICKELL